MSKPVKNPTTFQGQVELLKSRGCIITDEQFCLEKLQSINYYRLSAYFLPFKNPDNTYRTGTTFNQVYNIYEFDRSLRSILLAALEEIEIFLRCNFAYFHAHKYGSLGYLDSANFSSRHNSDRFKEILDREIENNKNVLFVKHHIEEYGGQFPAWVITELFTFGMLSYFYADLISRDQKYLSKYLYHNIPKNIISYLRCCTDLRNICAHYGRLYYRIFPAIPADITVKESAKRRLWGQMQAVKILFPNKDNWNTKIVPKLQKLFSSFENDIQLWHIAFPDNWVEYLKK
jgi:abortive infection bacteriophage resistance protein